MPLVYAEGSDPIRWGVSGATVLGAEVLWADHDLYGQDGAAFKTGLRRLMCRAKLLQKAEEMGALSSDPSAPTLIVMGSFESDQTHFQMAERAGFIDDSELNILEAYAEWLRDFVCPAPHAYILSAISQFSEVLESCRLRVFADRETSVLILQDGGPIHDQVETFIKLIKDSSILTPVRCGVPVVPPPAQINAVPIGPGPLNPAPVPVAHADA